MTITDNKVSKTSSLENSHALNRRVAVLLIGLLVLVACCFAGLIVGSRPIALSETFGAITHFDATNNAHLIILQLRIPRTIAGALVGAALGAAGAIMQAVTRNPLAEPGLLGINSGAAVAIVIGNASFQLSSLSEYVWLGFIGAGLAAAIVFILGRAHNAGTNPVRLVLAGAGVSIVLGTIASVILINTPDLVLDSFRNWSAGTLEGRGYDVLPVIAISTVVGLAIAQSIAPSLNGVALGLDTARALGIELRWIWTLSSLAVLLLAGAATAVAGPIAFVGLIAPHIARSIVGPDYRFLIPFSALYASILLLVADVCGRVVAFPSEIAAGVIAALIGGPFFIYQVRRFRISKL